MTPHPFLPGIYITDEGKMVAICDKCGKVVKFKKIFGWLHLCVDGGEE